MIKTNAMRILDKAHVTYQVYDYSKSSAISAEEVAAYLNEQPEKVFKTLVTIGKSKEHYIFVIPATKELDLKKAAKAAEEKNIEMIHQKELFPLTGYVHGGCSPLGMKKSFKTFVDISALNYMCIFISGGKIGYQIEIAPSSLQEIIHCDFTTLTN